MTDLHFADGLAPADMAAACGATIDTLRYYEREGLLDPIARTGGGQRRYRATDVAWVEILRCLRVTALPIREMRRIEIYSTRTAVDGHPSAALPCDCATGTPQSNEASDRTSDQTTAHTTDDRN